MLDDCGYTITPGELAIYAQPCGASSVRMRHVRIVEIGNGIVWVNPIDWTPESWRAKKGTAIRVYPHRLAVIPVASASAG